MTTKKERTPLPNSTAGEMGKRSAAKLTRAERSAKGRSASLARWAKRAPPSATP
jgi:hypothetical protein